MFELHKLAFRLAWEFVKNNALTSLFALAIMILIQFLSYLPIVGFLASFAYMTVIQSMQIYFARTTEESYDPQEPAERALLLYKERVSGATLSALFGKYIKEAVGSVFGYLIIFFLVSILFSLLLVSSGGSVGVTVGASPAMIAEEIEISALWPAFLILALISFLGYLLPAVQGEIIQSDSMQEAFKKSFLLLNPVFWKKTFCKRYFVLIMWWSLVVILIFAVAVISIMSVVLLPVGLALLFLATLYNALIYLFASRSLCS